MKGSWILVVAGVVAAAGCTTTPKRPMRATTGEEFPEIPPGQYTTTRDLPRDRPLVAPKSNTPGLNTAGGMGGMRGPGPVPGTMPGGVR
jgi:hypothetical protein